MALLQAWLWGAFWMHAWTQRSCHSDDVSFVQSDINGEEDRLEEYELSD